MVEKLLIDDLIIRKIRRNDASLTSLDLSSKNLTDADVFDLCKALKTNSNLTHLNLSRNKITDAGIVVLIQNNHLVSLDLSYNQIVEIGQNVTKGAALLDLNLSYNQINSTGAQTLSDMALTSLDISYNKLGEIELKILSQSKTLKKLAIREHKIEGAGLGAFAQNTTLISLIIHTDYCGFINNVEEILTQNKTIEELELSGAAFNQSLVPALIKNTTLLSINLMGVCLDYLTFENLAQNQTLTSLSCEGTVPWFQRPSSYQFEKNTTLISIKIKVGQLVDYRELFNLRNADYRWLTPDLKSTYRAISSNSYRTSLLIIACEEQNLISAESLLKGRMRLYWHEQWESAERTKFMLPKETLLHFAVRKGNIQLLNLLLQYATDAERRRRNKEGLTYVELAQQLSLTLTDTPTNTMDDVANDTKTSDNIIDNPPVIPNRSFLQNLLPSTLAQQTLTTANWALQGLASYVYTQPPAAPVVSQTIATTTTAPQQTLSGSSTNIEKPSPTLSKETTAQLTAAGMDIPNTLTVISTLQTKHEVLLKALSDWESRAQQDAQEQADLEEIAQEPEVKAYYQMLKAILAQSFLAATVIASGKIDGNTGVGIKAISGLSTLSSAASSASVAVFPLAAPILGFFKVVSSTVSSTLTYREMQQHVKWVEFEEIPQFAATLARRLALAQKRSIAAGISRTDETTWSKIKNQCNLFIEQLKSGTTFSSGEKRALLDAQLLFEYILTHDRPLDMTLSGRINILLQHLVGAQATLISSVSANNNNAIVVAQNNQPDITQLLQEIAALKAARETDQLDQQEQARRLQELHDKIRTLQEQQIPKNASNHVDVGNGQIQQLTMQTQDSAHASSNASVATLTEVYKRLAEHDEAVAMLGRQTAMTQEQLAALEKANSGKTEVESDDEDEDEENNMGSSGACCVM